MLSNVLIIDKRRELPAKYKKCIDSEDVKAVISRDLKDGMFAIQNLEPDMIIISDSIGESLDNFCANCRRAYWHGRYDYGTALVLLVFVQHPVSHAELVVDVAMHEISIQLSTNV